MSEIVPAAREVSPAVDAAGSAESAGSAAGLGTGPAAGSASRWLRGPLRPFGSGQYRLLSGYLLMSLLAAGVWLIALVWQIIAMDGGPTELSFVAAATAVGMLATTLLGGVLADRVPQRSILLVVAVVRTAAIGVVATLALLGWLKLWQLATVALLIGLGNGFIYPAYSALLPSVLPAEQLMAANGVEGMLRPTVMQAAGPAVASGLIAAFSPAAAITVVGLLELAGVAFLLALCPMPLRGDRPPAAAHPVRGLFIDLRDGFLYMVRTPWLLATLLFASVLVLLIMGPIEVLVPFAIKDRAGGGPAEHAIVMAAFGIGGAIGSLSMASMKMPRRYLTIMNLLWGMGCLPLALVGFATDVWVIAAAVFVVGLCFSAPMVIWGTLLQRRVAPHMLGRVSSLDFFVSLAFMPVSMALAGPVSAGVGLGPTFALAGLLPTAVAVLAILLAKMPKDELAHPLDTPSTTDIPLDEPGTTAPRPASPADSTALDSNPPTSTLPDSTAPESTVPDSTTSGPTTGSATRQPTHI